MTELYNPEDLLDRRQGEADVLMKALEADMAGVKGITMLVGPLNIDGDGTVILTMAHNYTTEEGYTITLWELKDKPVEIRLQLIEELKRVFEDVWDIDDKITFIANIGAIWNDQDMTALSLKMEKRKRADLDAPSTRKPLEN